MDWKQWSLVAVLIGGGILLQIPGHDDADMDHGATHPAKVDHGTMHTGTMTHEAAGHATMPAGMADPRPPYATVALDVTGMT